MQKVKLYLRLCGDYVAFHEISASLLYDITNNEALDTYSLEEIKEMIGRGDYCDIEEVDGIKTEDGSYFYQI